MALRNARDLYTRRQEGVSLWVVPSAEIVASSTRTSATRSSTRRPTRSTGTRRSTTSPRGSSTCDHLDARRPRHSTTSSALADDALVSAQRTGLVDQPRAAARGGRRARQHRPRPARPGPHAARLRRAGSRAPGAARTTSPTCATSASSATSSWSSAPQTDFGVADGAAAAVLGLAVRAVRRPAREHRRDPRRGRRQGGQGGRLPPRPRRAVGAAARRRHRRVAHAGCRRRSTPSGPTSTSCSTPGRRARWSTPGSPSTRPLRAAVLAADRAGARRGHADRARRSRPAVGGGRRGLHTEQLGYLLAEMQHLHRSHPGATW